MIYINRKDDNYLETVDEFDKAKGCAYKMLQEYRISDSSAHYYLSQRACKDWRVKKVLA
jgi:hypothetical protein